MAVGRSVQIPVILNEDSKIKLEYHILSVMLCSYAMLLHGNVSQGVSICIIILSSPIDVAYCSITKVTACETRTLVSEVSFLFFNKQG